MKESRPEGEKDRVPCLETTGKTGRSLLLQIIHDAYKHDKDDSRHEHDVESGGPAEGDKEDASKSTSR